MSAEIQQITDDELSAFLNEAGWGGAQINLIGGDAGLRRYFRLNKAGETALLMDMSRSGYEASLDAYITIGRFLTEKNVRVPKVYEASLDNGLSIIEDLGDISFGDVLKSGREQRALYEIATDVLIAIRQNIKSNDLRLGTYAQSRIRERLHQFVDFYVPAVTGDNASAALQEEFQNVMAQIENSLPACPQGFCHADYHLENLMWRPDVPEKYGLIDFQDGFWGPLPYDLLNLLEDARQDVPEGIKADMKARYCADMSEDERKIFDDWYVLLSAHFHCRVIGLFVKLAVERDMPQYLEHIPRLQAYISKEIENPVLTPLKEWLERHNIPLDKTPNL